MDGRGGDCHPEQHRQASLALVLVGSWWHVHLVGGNPNKAGATETEGMKRTKVDMEIFTMNLCAKLGHEHCPGISTLGSRS
jgi:hypothetical protein